MKKCTICSIKIDKDHDAYYYCKCNAELKVTCKECVKSNDRCSICHKPLNHHSESITKKAYFNPATRNGLGF